MSYRKKVKTENSTPKRRKRKVNAASLAIRRKKFDTMPTNPVRWRKQIHPVSIISNSDRKPSTSVPSGHAQQPSSEFTYEVAEKELTRKTRNRFVTQFWNLKHEFVISTIRVLDYDKEEMLIDNYHRGWRLRRQSLKSLSWDTFSGPRQ